MVVFFKNDSPPTTCVIEEDAVVSFTPIGLSEKPAGLCGMWVIDRLTTASQLLMSPSSS